MIEITEEPNTNTINNEVPICKIASTDLSYNDFFHKFMNQNQPVIITSISDNWLCSQHWIRKNEHSQGSSINYDYLQSAIPNVQVPIADCRKRCSNSHAKFSMNFYDFLHFWKEYNPETDDRLFYLKDWHMKNELPTYQFYSVPLYFGSDWLNEYLIESGQDDYRFVYMGPQGTWTPLHADVFGSFSWSTNIVGRKRWLFLLPGEEVKLFDQFGNVPFTITEDQLRNLNVGHCQVTQEAGESLFVPSGWYHQVFNQTDTISINHNWFNACNIQEIWKILFENFLKVCHEIEDCRGMDNFEEHCQVMLKASHGMNFSEFLKILRKIAANRTKYLSDGVDQESTINGFIYGQNHCEFDLKAILSVVQDVREKCYDINVIGSQISEDCKTIERIIDGSSI